VKSWDRWGISMRPNGQWDFSGHAFPGRPRVALKNAGHNQKEILTQQAKKQRVRIENHLLISDIITEGDEVIGAIAVSTKEDIPVIKVIRAKSIILATGCGSRLYPAVSPGWMFNTANCPVCTGSGQAMAYHVGAKLINMEFPHRHAGPKFFARCGKATWIGLYKDAYGKLAGPFVTQATRELGDITGDIWSSVFTEKFRSGEGPVYMDCGTTSDDDFDYMMWGLVEEGNTAMLNYMAAEGIDLRDHRVEFMQYEPFLVGRGIEIDLNAETNVPGLFAPETRLATSGPMSPVRQLLGGSPEKMQPEGPGQFRTLRKLKRTLLFRNARIFIHKSCQGDTVLTGKKRIWRCSKS